MGRRAKTTETIESDRYLSGNHCRTTCCESEKSTYFITFHIPNELLKITPSSLIHKVSCASLCSCSIENEDQKDFSRLGIPLEIEQKAANGFT